ncbi:DUF4191 domain-containing protein [Corynebacterium uterequi]|uniref:Putative DUF4191 family protein n=1 Tax=Corynebacterium uterequi TaxID=1072256 RepID=A0A0G3HDR7_9CORY|nr:DUF4191 domain-containing protein [Corynebacterium uterequi]AKK11511.1 putative DUF4191 family protein [Corynebacterium uterequi]
MANDAKKKSEAAKAARKEERQAKRAQRTQTLKQLWQAFNMLRKQDKMLIPLMLICVLGTALIMFLIGLLWNGQWFMLFSGILLGIVLAMFVFTRRLESSMYDRIEDQTGAAAWALENMRNSMGVVWITKTGIAGTTQMDVVHRVVGNPGVVLVGEGSPHRLKPLMKQQSKKVNRLVAGVPIHEVYVGEDEAAGQVPLKKLQRSLLKLPRNYGKDEVYSLASKIDALDNVRGGQGAGVPKGPLPKQARSMAGMNRRMRRAQNRGR